LVIQKIEQNCGIHTEIPDKQKRIYRTGAEAISAVTDCATAQTIRMRNAMKTIALSMISMVTVTVATRARTTNETWPQMHVTRCATIDTFQ
jgi:hypothetical protein